MGRRRGRRRLVTSATPGAAPAAPYPEQRRAAAPDASVWVEASAGSGKTKVLADRVIRLMLDGTAPDRILCLTFTRAAAAEMSIRINAILGNWSSASDPDLRESLEELLGEPPADEVLARSRRLFAEVLDVPGGMKIQTIHAFCESLLGRFPLEADVAPHFEVMDERTAAEIMHAARDEILTEAARAPDGPLARALAEVTFHASEQSFSALMEEMSRERGRIQRLLRRHGGPDGYRTAICGLLGVGETETDDDVLAAACDDKSFDLNGLRHAVDALRQGSQTDEERGEKIASWLDAGPTRRERFQDYFLAYFVKNDDGKPNREQDRIRKSLITKKAAEKFPEVADLLAAEANRLAAVQEKRNAVAVARASAALMSLAAAVLDAYEAHKAEHARLDYDDLILCARRLLERDGGVSWVLYKLDGGIDHVLIDEAQDTNPDQWAVVRAIADEFHAGASGRETVRTVFAVGDTKQSIFSFQRADPAEFARMSRYFAERAIAVSAKWDRVGLDVSFRSTPAVLTAVDAVFAQESARDGLGNAPVRHQPHRSSQAGQVELWPLVAPSDEEEITAWSPPPDRVGRDPPATRLAVAITDTIRRWIDEGERLPSRDRTIRPGDILILVQRRTGFVDDLVRALKNRDVPVAGIDRLVLSDHLAVMDLVALGQVLLLPEDDLTLATVLKGPFIGFDDDLLFDLAHDRKGSLWGALNARAPHDGRFEAARDVIADLLSRVDYVTPFRLYAELIGAGRGREAIVARLGPDANDPVDEFLSLALAYERAYPPSLQGFLHWFLHGQTEIKRDLEQADKNEVRIMTVHGAKGLQAPVVFLADTVRTPATAGASRPQLCWRAGEGEGSAMLWRPRAALREPVTAALAAAAKARSEQEYRRLLYVAMTRAEDRLYICGYRTKRKAADDCWYRLIERGLAAVAQPLDFPLASAFGPETDWEGQALRLRNDQHGEPDKSAARERVASTIEPLPPWAVSPAPEEPDPPRPLAPSRPADDEPAALSPVGGDRERRFARGLLIHDLLQFLPPLPEERRHEAARRYLARPVHGLSPDEQAAIAAEAVAVMLTPAFADVFGPASRAEVPLVGVVNGAVVSGRVDRLVVGDREVTVVDYKSNRPAPAREEDVPSAYLHQLAAYRAVLSKIYPESSINCALLWTEGPRLMPISPALLDSHAP